MQTLPDTQTLPDIDPQLEDDFIEALAAAPTRYGEIRNRLPAPAEDVFASRAAAWNQLVQAIESGSSTAGMAGQPSGVDLLEAADRLSELYWRRVLTHMANTTLHDLRAGRPAQGIAEAFGTELADMRRTLSAQPASALTWADGVVESLTHELAAAAIARAAGQKTMGIAASGLPTLDLVLNGWQRGALYVLGGAPGVGKTSLALQWACDAIIERDLVVVYVTYENSPQNLALKAIGRLAGVSPGAIERGRADPERWAKGLARFRAVAPNLALITADIGTSIDFVEATTREALARRPGRGLVIVDYLQRMAYSERYGNLQDNVAALAQRLRDLAALLDLPVIAISALAPGVEDSELRLSMLAHHGELEYASDVVLLLGARAAVSLASADRLRNTHGLHLLDLMIAKNRYGEASRTIPLLFRPATGDFQEEPTT